MMTDAVHRAIADEADAVKRGDPAPAEHRTARIGTITLGVSYEEKENQGKTSAENLRVG